MTPGDLARVADIRARQRCTCAHELRDHIDGTGRCTEDNDRDWHCPCIEFRPQQPADVPWLLDRLAAETERADKAEAAVERVRGWAADLRRNRGGYDRHVAAMLDTILAMEATG